jgi:hypothetical protein
MATSLYYQPGQILRALELPGADSDSASAVTFPVSYLAGAYAEGYSYGAERTRLSGSVLVRSTPVGNGNTPWYSLGWEQRKADVLINRNSTDPNTSLGFPPLDQRNVRLVGGDSGGPLYSIAQFSNGTTGYQLVGIASLSGSLSGTEALGAGPDDAFWVNVDHYRTLVADMADSLRSMPTEGATAAFPYLPTLTRRQGRTTISHYSATAGPRMTYFDPPAGELEELEFLTPGVGFLAIDFLDLDTSTLHIQTLADAEGNSSAVDFVLSGNVARLALPYRGLRLEGLGVETGTELTLGFQVASLDGTTQSGDFQWRGINALQPVPEPASAWSVLIGLLLIGVVRASGLRGRTLRSRSAQVSQARFRS